MRKATVVLLFLAALIAGAATELRAEFTCDGNACKDVQLWFENGCHNAKNTGSRKVKVQRGAFGKVLSPGETWQVRNLDGSCIEIFIGGTTANYVD